MNRISVSFFLIVAIFLTSGCTLNKVESVDNATIDSLIKETSISYIDSMVKILEFEEVTEKNYEEVQSLWNQSIEEKNKYKQLFNEKIQLSEDEIEMNFIVSMIEMLSFEYFIKLQGAETFESYSSSIVVGINQDDLERAKKYDKYRIFNSLEELKNRDIEDLNEDINYLQKEFYEFIK